MPKLNPPPRRTPQDAGQEQKLFYQQLVDAVYQLFYAADYANPQATVDIVAANGLTPSKRIMRVQGSGGAVTVISTPNISDAFDGTELLIQGDSDSNTVTFQDESSLSNSGLALAGGANCTLGKGDVLHLIYDSGDNKWYEVSRSNN